VGVRPALRTLPMNILIVVVTVLCFGYLVYAMVEPERF
jgi:K+-transporting ATPase KdpF subunit